ncbi:prolyl aminopeptidase [Streptomyces telluris]|uniref:Proline iminopeptidase n=1 Tax=Streptomyces telluris TaxID=2720021 RepID=A0A9X2LBV4_9ACTN|nr:prolyl aminopeptidase [Streptomyces telluris]MCQ8768411.1 prolyl aminopeptidase [Streptomyces telluris]NJP79011.1 prolyl aminopeptidase [Streptomyces telluris]
MGADAEGLYPPVEPYETGLLDVGDGNLVYWEACGNPEGKPALVVHGGPGSGCGTGVRRYFDPDRYRVVLFDQRGCGRSTPHASDPATDMRHNTTAHLIADMERLRTHLGVDRWLLYGGSWGSTLLLAYAETYPERVSEIVVSGVTTTRRSEIDWLYRGAGRFFPEQWESFLAGAAGTPRDGDVVAAYARLTEHPDAAVREKATADWCAWEDAVLSGETEGATAPYTGRAAAARLALVRICAHYFSHGAWLEEGALLRDAGRLAGIPGVLVHGRLDLAGPLGTAWELARAWPGSRLVVVDGAGHLGTAATRRHVLGALDAFARHGGTTPAPGRAR